MEEKFKSTDIPIIFKGIVSCDPASSIQEKYVISDKTGDIAEVYYIPEFKEWSIIIDNFPMPRKFYKTSFPINSAEDFQKLLKKIGINLERVSPSMEGEETAKNSEELLEKILNEFGNYSLAKGKFMANSNSVAAYASAFIRNEHPLIGLKLDYVHPSVTPPSEVLEEAKSEAVKFIDETSPNPLHGFKRDLLSHHLYKHVINHMARFAVDFATKIKAVEPSEAVEFAEWTNNFNKCEYYPVYDTEQREMHHWENREDNTDHKTTEELYQLFKTNKE